MLEPLPRIALTVPQAALALGVSERTMWKILRTGKLRHARVGRRVLISVQALREFVEAGGLQDQEWQSGAPARAPERRDQ